MANRRLTRPLEPVPSWSNDDLLDDPGEAWHTTDAKAQPGGGKRDDGFLPEEEIPAQHVNQLLHEDKLWIQYMADIQVMNWSDVGTPQEAATPNSAEALCWDAGTASWFCGGRANQMESSFDEESWNDITSGLAVGSLTWAASKHPSAAPAHTGGRVLVGGDNAAAVAEFAGSWTNSTLPGTAPHSVAGVWDGPNNLWIVVGDENSAPEIWTDTTTISGFTQQNPTAVNSTTCVDVASGDDLIVVAGDGTAPNIDVWTSADGATWTRATPTGITAGEEIRAVRWDPERALFVMLTDKSCYTSVNGTSWVNLVTYTTGEFQWRCLAISGSIYVAANGTSGPGIRYSTDGGVVWRVLKVSVGDADTTVPLYNLAYSPERGRFLASWGNDPNSGRVVRSLACGTSLYTVDGTSTPTVT